MISDRHQTNPGLISIRLKPLPRLIPNQPQIGSNSSLHQFRRKIPMVAFFNTKTSICSLVFQFFRICGPDALGLVPLDSDRHSLSNASIDASGALIWSRIVEILSLFANVHVFLTCLLVGHGDMSSCHFLSHNRTRLLVQQEDMSSCSRSRHVFLFNKKQTSILFGKCAHSKKTGAEISCITI